MVLFYIGEFSKRLLAFELHLRDVHKKMENALNIIVKLGSMYLMKNVQNAQNNQTFDNATMLVALV
jgi:hypothetical protein